VAVSVVFSLGNNSLVTPISTLEASPANISNDLFCAFQPKRVMVPSLPLRLKVPEMPSAAAAAAVAGLLIARLFTRVWSGVASTRPKPNVGVGMRKLIELFPKPWKLNWGIVQPGASVRPSMVKSSATPNWGTTKPPVPPPLTSLTSRDGPSGWTSVKGGPFGLNCEGNCGFVLKLLLSSDIA